jgi:CrcB protein
VTAAVLVVAAGGALGAVCRYLLMSVVQQRWGTRFLGGAGDTLVVNVLGCLAIGLLYGLVETRDVLPPRMRLFLFTGLLGGFTTWSTFALEAVELFEGERAVQAWSFLALSLVLGIGAVVLGLRISRAAFGAG